MGYIGNIPAEKYTTFAKQTFTPDSSTVAFTLDYPVANENELAVFVNNVRQEPGSGKAYTATGNTLTMSEAPTSGHAMYAIYLGKTMATNTPADGSVTNARLAGSIANDKLANSSITLNGSAVSLGGSATTATTNGRQVLLSTQTPSGASSVEFINGSGSIDFGSTYKYHIFEFENISSSSSGDFLLFNGSTNGGSSYSVSKTHVHLQAGVNAGSYFGLTVDTGQSFEDGTGQATLVAGVDTALNTDRLITGTFFAYQSSATSYGKNYKGEFIYDASGTVKAKMQFPFGIMQTTSAITAYKFWMNTGTITGTIRLYGVTV